jgi:hypothetical protein
VLGSARDTVKDSSMINAKISYSDKLINPMVIKNKMKDGYVMTARIIRLYATAANKGARSRLFLKKENPGLQANLMKMRRL